LYSTIQASPRVNIGLSIPTSVAEPHHFYAAPAPGENFDAAIFSKAKFLKRNKVYTHVETILFICFCTICIAENMN
jgi:hypothetical protein